MEIEGKTKTGNLDFKLAAAACYLPVSFLHLVAAVVFLAAEPKEHRFVRFHAVQSIVLFAVIVGGSLATVVLGMVVFPLILVVVGIPLSGAASAVSEDLAGLIGAIVGLLSFVSYVGGAVIGIGLSLVFMPAFLGTAVLVMTGKTGRWPVFGGLAERFV